MVKISRKNIVFDTGPIINFASSGILPKLTGLKKHYSGDFLITNSVEKELIDRPLATKKFRLEAFQVLKEIRKGTLKDFDDESIDRMSRELLDVANSTFKAKGHWIRIVSFAEMSVLASAIELGSELVVIDERTTRLLVEDIDSLAAILERKLHTKVSVDEQKKKLFSNMTRGIKVIRSVELAVLAYDYGLFDEYTLDGNDLESAGISHHKFENPKLAVLESLLWAIKLNGCSVTTQELARIIKVHKKQSK